MRIPTKFIIEGIDRLGKDTLIQGLQKRCGFFQEIHYTKPKQLAFYESGTELAVAQQRYQADCFRTMFGLLRSPTETRIILNRAHLGECVYAPLYRGYSGDYVFELETAVQSITEIRLVLLTEDFSISSHFMDDGASLGNTGNRQREQELFLSAFRRSAIRDKRLVCVTASNGSFKKPEAILDEILLSPHETSGIVG